ncbi:MAG: NAD(P)-dependent oxidoreductase [Candidatus Marinimicrobia bacterium]|nr:NAD(P)-dependent oxidoreductase [Candidatus Neomarinimicrobiota bacterium]MCF7827931.1 NAD(P)-dependent oxidoreductase [Candidatus Neomarinimicrobiota bacterium]MCF7879314.1 NAD(P)-dependent oxidoreductase [Candidatus Neomarinimicrobiota bacterium]
MDKKIGFIGLGTMGAPMAKNIHSAGYELSVYNRSPEKTEPFRGLGVPVYGNPTELTEHSEVIFIMVTGPDALKDVLLRDDGVINGMRPGTIVANMSTVSPEATLGAAELVESADGRFVDAPVSGTKKPAEDGTLVMLAGGDESLVENLTPVLSTMGKEIIYCGETGQATNMKLMINLLLGSMMQGLSEALMLGKKTGLSPEKMLQTIEAGGLSAPFYTAKANAIRSGNFAKNFPVELMLKDLNLALESGGNNGVALPQTAAAREMFSAANASGFGDEDMAAVIKVLEQIAGTVVRD